MKEGRERGIKLEGKRRRGVVKDGIKRGRKGMGEDSSVVGKGKGRISLFSFLFVRIAAKLRKRKPTVEKKEV